MIKDIVPVHFTSIKDLQNRICALWQDQKENESYDFTFENEEVEKAFNDLVVKFTRPILH